MIAGIIIISAFLLYYYRSEVSNYFISPDGPSAPKIVQVGNEIYAERIEREVIDPSKMSLSGRLWYRLKTIFVGESYTEQIILESPVILRRSDLTNMSLPQKILELNAHYSKANLETVKALIMVDHYYDEEDFARLADQLIGDKKVVTINEFKSFLDLSPRSLAATSLDHMRSDENVYFGPADSESYPLLEISKLRERGATPDDLASIISAESRRVSPVSGKPLLPPLDIAERSANSPSSENVSAVDKGKGTWWPIKKYDEPLATDSGGSGKAVVYPINDEFGTATIYSRSSPASSKYLEFGPLLENLEVY